mmetsp:Transcript_8891/g.26092  ORF Transcript_8891/g.26092 Transcript_8891/m.26092 type:complete len:318 (+) Transcript_8891:370-1323(+)
MSPLLPRFHLQREPLPLRLRLLGACLVQPPGCTAQLVQGLLVVGDGDVLRLGLQPFGGHHPRALRRWPPAPRLGLHGEHVGLRGGQPALRLDGEHLVGGPPAHRLPAPGHVAVGGGRGVLLVQERPAALAQVPGLVGLLGPALGPGLQVRRAALALERGPARPPQGGRDVPRPRHDLLQVAQQAALELEDVLRLLPGVPPGRHPRHGVRKVRPPGVVVEGTAPALDLPLVLVPQQLPLLLKECLRWLLKVAAARLQDALQGRRQRVLPSARLAVAVDVVHVARRAVGVHRPARRQRLLLEAILGYPAEFHLLCRVYA